VVESDTPIDNLEGRALGPYRDLVLIGKGAMSYVYRGRQPALHRWVAIKVLPPRFLHTADFIRRFQREAEIVASFQHAHILPIFDADCDSDIPYLVMPYAPGGTLRQRMREPLPLHRAITLLQQVCDALEYAHTRQPTVVHRDVKPSNILLLREDFALLGDFGLAKVLQTPAVSAQSRTGVVGTPEYMAPEQALRGEVDGRTDVYAVGIILYEILTGRPPFTGKLPVEVMLQHIREPLSPVRTLNPAIPEAWEEVVQRALAKDPADRYPSAAVLRAALEEAHRGRPEAMIATPGTQGAEREPPLSHLFHEAESAFTVEDWERTISLCGQILRLAPDSPVALQLLRRAQERRNEARQRELAECLERAEAPGAERGRRGHGAQARAVGRVAGRGLRRGPG
jgi:serine/threonine protein kinase